jgi:hypothetical protein
MTELTVRHLTLEDVRNSFPNADWTELTEADCPDEEWRFRGGWVYRGYLGVAHPAMGLPEGTTIRVWSLVQTYINTDTQFLSWDVEILYSARTLVYGRANTSYDGREYRTVEGFVAYAPSALHDFNRRLALYEEVCEYLEDQDNPPSARVTKADVEAGDVLVPDRDHYFLVYPDGNRYSIRVAAFEMGHSLEGRLLDRVIVDRTTKKDVYVREPGSRGRAWPIRNAISGAHNLTGWRKVAR